MSSADWYYDNVYLQPDDEDESEDEEDFDDDDDAEYSEQDCEYWQRVMRDC